MPIFKIRICREEVLYGEEVLDIEALSEEDAANKGIMAVEEEGCLPNRDWIIEPEIVTESRTYVEILKGDSVMRTICYLGYLMLDNKRKAVLKRLIEEALTKQAETERKLLEEIHLELSKTHYLKI